MKTRIKELRRENNFTQEFLAAKVGATQAALSKIECGLRVPDASLLVQLSDIFQVTTDYILFLSNHRFSADHMLEVNFNHPENREFYAFILKQFSTRIKAGSC